MTLSSSLVKSTVVAALGGLLFGFDTAVIAGTTAALTRTFDLTPGGLGLTVAAALVGTILGAMLAGIPGDRYGRRDSLREWRCFMFYPQWGAPSPGIGIRWSSSASSAASESGVRPCWVLCILPRSPRPDGAAGWLDFPVQRRRGHSAGVPFELPGGNRRLRRAGMALEAGSGGDTRSSCSC